MFSTQNMKKDGELLRANSQKNDINNKDDIMFQENRMVSYINFSHRI